MKDIKDAILHITAQQLRPELTFLNNKGAFMPVRRVRNWIPGSGFTKIWRSTDPEQRGIILTKHNKSQLLTNKILSKTFKTLYIVHQVPAKQ